ncbi:MAG: DUF1559 domain-containing protein [Gemmataceae bacterium]
MRINQGKQKGFTLIELLVVIGIIAVLLGLLVPAVQKVRAAAFRIECANNMKQLGLAAQNYSTRSMALPPIKISDRAHPIGWGYFLLPYLEQDSLYNGYDFTKPFYDPCGNQAIANTIVKVFTCPVAPKPQVYSVTTVVQSGLPNTPPHNTDLLYLYRCILRLWSH